MPFEITAQEKRIDENVTGSSVEADLAAALKAANARHAYDQVMAEENVTGWDEATKDTAQAGVDAALVLADALGGPQDHFKVNIHGDGHFMTVHVQKVNVDAPTLTVAAVEEVPDAEA